MTTYYYDSYSTTDGKEFLFGYDDSDPYLGNIDIKGIKERNDDKKMSIEGLKKIREEYFNEGGKFGINNKISLIDYFMKTTIEVFEEQADHLTVLDNKVKGLITLYKDIVIDEHLLEKRVEKLKQQDSYSIKEDLKDFKIGGTD